jgi:hypothetical protein
VLTGEGERNGFLNLSPQAAAGGARWKSTVL